MSFSGIYLTLEVYKLLFDSTQWWKDVPLGPPDIILGIYEAYQVDPNPNKIDLSVGAYRCEQGKPYVLKSILKAEQNIVDRMPHKESESNIGSKYFRDVTFQLAVGEKLLDREKVSVQVSIRFSSSLAVFHAPVRIFSHFIFTQSVSGSGSIKIAAETIAKIYKGNNLIFISNPSWAYHEPIFRLSGVNTAFYRYYDARNHEIDHTGLMTDLMVGIQN